MEKSVFKSIGILFLLAGIMISVSAQQKDFSTLVAQLAAAKECPNVLVAAHRGDWRHAPENSIQSLENVIKMGVDIYELDLKMTKDSVLVLMHDKTIDRTVDKKGRPEDYTLAELKSFRLRNGLGRGTHHQIPTLEEFFIKSKGRILIDIDKGYSYLPQVLKLVEKHQMQNQIIINIDAGVKLQDAESTYGTIPENIILMPIIALNQPDYKTFAESFKQRKNTIFQPVFSKENQEALNYIKGLKREGYHIWLNSLWPSLNAGHDDDRAVELDKMDEIWGWLIRQGATILQTDRPLEMLHYIDTRKQ